MENNNNTIIINELGLNYRETKILFSLQYHIVAEDIKLESDIKKKELKAHWLNDWRKSIENFLESQLPYELKDVDSSKLFVYYNSLEYNTIKLKKFCESKIPLYLILFETTLFEPYYQFNPKDNKEYCRLKLASKEQTNQILIEYSRLLGIDSSYIDKYRNTYKKAVRSIKGTVQKIAIGTLVGTILIGLTAGYAAPFISSFFAAPGLTGAAAISSGLAALGGGSIATGGFGMAGGMAVIVGGGSIIGASSGLGLGMLLSITPDFALSQSAKLEVVLKEIILNIYKNTRIAQELIREQTQAIKRLEEELFKLKIDNNNNKDKIKNLEKTINYISKSLNRNKRLCIKRSHHSAFKENRI